MRNTRDIKLADAVGAAVELALFALAFVAGSASPKSASLVWLEISQMPGAQIALELFRHVGRLPAFICAYLIQASVFAAITLGAIRLFVCCGRRGKAA
jgi:hypothetical protein